MRKFWVFCLVLVCLFWGAEAQAGILAERLAQFPKWESKPSIEAVNGVEDLVYPDWMAGTWNVTSTLVDLVAPLAPEVVTPGFESNRQYLDKPISFKVRFGGVSEENFELKTFPFVGLKTQNAKQKTTSVVADRAFNGFNIARATLGEGIVLSVKVDPKNPNRQITSLPGNLQLVSLVMSRGSETPSSVEFISSEVCQQLFRGATQLYLNEVETTTVYRRQEASNVAILADQITAVYLSPQDPNYFQAVGKPVALYRYRLELVPIGDW